MENPPIHKINLLRNKPWVKEEIKRETRENLEVNESRSTTCQNGRVA